MSTSAEKYLKAFILLNDVEPNRTHDLKILNKECKKYESRFSKIDRECNNLTYYGVAPKYPFNLDITEHHMNKAIEDAEKIKVFVESKLII